LPELPGLAEVPAEILFALEVNSSFSNLYCYLLLALAAVCLLLRFYLLAPLLLIVGGIHGSRLDVEELSWAAEGKRLKICYYNVWIHNQRRAEIRDLVLRHDADLVLLTEIDEQWIKDLNLSERYPHSYLHPGVSSDGSVIYSKYPLKDSRRIPEEGYFAALRAEVDLSGEPLSLYFVHATPPQEDYTFSEREGMLKSISAEMPDRGRTIVVGDFNTSFSSPRFKRIEKLLQLKTQAGMPFATWKLQNLAFVGTKIDHLYHGEQIAVTNIIQGEDLGSDHYPVIWEVVVK
jgi:endonuclease/exonuclease/phosphatase (EEP) superfamily protein YafD